MRIAIYTIAKNEEENVEQWLDTTKDADYRIIGDTGSTDATVDKLLAGKAMVGRIGPDAFKTEYIFRFDHARNAALSLVPNDVDYCLVNDMDEILRPGWRKDIEAWLETQPRKPNKVQYNFIQSFNDDGSVRSAFIRDIFHTRNQYTWKYPCHEALVPKETFDEVIAVFPNTIQEHHHPEDKNRDYYLDLLKLGAEEFKDDNRFTYNLGREYFRQKKFDDAAKVWEAYLARAQKTPAWPPEHAAVLRFLAEINMHKCVKAMKSRMTKAAAHQHNIRIQRLELACRVYPEGREPLLDLADALCDDNQFFDARRALRQMFKITEKQPISFTEERAWGKYAQDMMAFVDSKCPR